MGVNPKLRSKGWWGRKTPHATSLPRSHHLPKARDSFSKEAFELHQPTIQKPTLSEKLNLYQQQKCFKDSKPAQPWGMLGPCKHEYMRSNFACKV